MDQSSKFLLSTAIALAASFVAIVWQQSLANGSGAEIYRGREGEYEVIVRVQPDRPVVGAIHFTITPLDTDTLVPVVHAEIDIVAYDPQGMPRYRVRALNPPLALQYYDANITIDSPGLWTLLVHVRSDSLGLATFTVPVHVDERALAQTAAGTIVWLVVLATLVAGSGYLWCRGRRLRGRV